VVIDQARVDELLRSSRALGEASRHVTILFGHASVGGNILGGLTALHDEDRERFPLKVRDGGTLPDPSGSEQGIVYGYSRGNPGWRGKIDAFRKSVQLGWHDRRLIAIDKFCYIDQDADATEYIWSMVDLERQHPETTFVYATMPLTTGEDQANLQRIVFNEKVRR
jgi:hypothetical protein